MTTQSLITPRTHLGSDIVTEIEDAAWDNFVLQNPGGHYVQTSLWGRVKATTGWQSQRITLCQAGQVLMGGQLLLRHLGMLGAVGYMPKAPVIATDDVRIHEHFFQALQAFSRRHRIQYLVVQPPNNGSCLENSLVSRGFRKTSLQVAPTATVVLDIADDVEAIIARMKRQTRQNVRRSQREGISVREAAEDDLPTFYELYLTTSQRQDFEPYPLEYFSTLWRIFAPSDYICIFLAEYEHKPLSALLVMRFGKTVYTKMCGWSGEEGLRRPNEAVYLAALQWAKARGCRYFDFEGLDRRAAELLVQGQSLPDDLKETPALFKLGFGGEVGLYPEAYEYFYNPVFRSIYYGLYPTINTWPPTRRFIERFYRHQGGE